MELVELVHVFVGLVEGLVPSRVKGPMILLADEIQSKVSRVDMVKGDLEERILDLERSNRSLQAENASLQNSSGRYAVELLRSLVDRGDVCSENDLIKQNIVAFYNATKQKIPAIKRLREITGMGLKEAKEAVEDWAGLR